MASLSYVDSNIKINLSIVVVALVGVVGAADQFHQIYLDVKPANTTWHLEALHRVPLSIYKLSYERSNANRVRIGMIGPELYSVIPEAVEIIPERILPPLEKGGESLKMKDVPVVHENTLFMYGLGATQEMSKILDKVEADVSQQISRVSDLFGEISRIEYLISEESNGTEILKLRALAAEAKITRAQLDMEYQKVQQEQEYSQALRETELEQIRRNEELTMTRLAREDEAARIRMQESMRQKFEASKKIERARLDAAETLSKMEHERELEVERAKEKLKEETEKAIALAKAQAERANEDVHLRRLKAEHEQRRQRNIAAIQTIFNNISIFIAAAAKNPNQVFLFICYIAFFAIGIYSAREAARLCRIVLESALGKPTLVRETTRETFPMSLLRIIIGKCIIFKRRHKSSSIEDKCRSKFEDLILPHSLKDRILGFSISASKARQHDAPHRHILLYGPPGTGKTMVAKKLAKCVDMDYALMSGGDVGPLGSDAVTQIHSLFSWAKLSPKGVLLFIDEAEAFLASRSKGNMGETAHNALNALLYHTGSERKDFFLVLATNRAEDLDAAVLDRCDESIYFPLPDASCRTKLISLYFDSYVKETAMKINNKNSSLYLRFKSFLTKQQIYIILFEEGVMSDDQLMQTVKETEGFSGREISKLMISMQSALYSLDDNIFSKEMAWKLVSTKVSEHKDKQRMVLQNSITRGDSKTVHNESI